MGSGFVFKACAFCDKAKEFGHGFFGGVDFFFPLTDGLLADTKFLGQFTLRGVHMVAQGSDHFSIPEDRVPCAANFVVENWLSEGDALVIKIDVGDMEACVHPGRGLADLGGAVTPPAFVLVSRKGEGMAQEGFDFL